MSPAGLGRHLAGLGAGLLLAAPLAWPLSGLDDHARLFGLILAAAVVALASPSLERHHWGPTLVEVLLVAIVALGLDPGGAEPIALAAGGAGALLVGGLLLRLGPVARRALAGLLVAAALVGAVAAGPRLVRSMPVHTWNQLHYVLGTKYFDEVGYHDLYPAMLLADQEGPRRLLHVAKVRDMHTYKGISRKEALARAQEEGLRDRFTDARWEAFQADLEVFWPEASPRTWAGVVTDLGYNPSPVWVVVHRPLLQVIDLSATSLRGLALLQIPAYALTLALSWWAFGRRATLWLVLWNALFFGNRGRLFGGYWSYDWLCLAIAAAALLQRGRPALAAIPVAVGGLMRGFGGLLALGPTTRWLVQSLRTRRLHPETTRFVLALGAAMALLLLASLGTARGLDAWGEWLDKIALHSARISTGGRHLGLKVLFGEDWSVPGHTADLDLRRQIYAGQAWAYHLVQAVLVGWTLLLLPRRRPLDAALLGFIPAFAGMVLSRYYYAAWGLLMLLGWREDRPQGRPLAQVGMLSVLALHEGQFLIAGTTPDSRHQAVNLLLLALAVATLAGWSWVDVRRWRANGPATLPPWHPPPTST